MESGLGLNVRALKAILWMVICAVLLNQGIVLVPPLEHLGMGLAAYAHHNLSIEALVSVNIICGVGMEPVIMARIVLHALKNVLGHVTLYILFVVIRCAALMSLVHHALKTVVNAVIVAMVSVKIVLEKLVVIALKTAELVHSHVAVMAIVIFTSMKTVRPVLKIAVYAHL
jgi:hypothetical protein